MNEKDHSLIKSVAELSKLSVDNKNASTLAKDMENMINFAALSNGSGNFAMSQIGNSLELREDVAKNTVDRTTLLSASANSNGEFFTVPRVIGGDGNE